MPRVPTSTSHRISRSTGPSTDVVGRPETMCPYGGVSMAMIRYSPNPATFTSCGRPSARTGSSDVSVLSSSDTHPSRVAS
jgi:hypothetical protein